MAMQPLNKITKAALILSAAILGSVVLDNILWKALEDNTICASSDSSLNPLHELQLQQVSLHGPLIL